MNITDQLSSQQGDKTEKSNRLVAMQCIENPELLSEIAKGFLSKDKKIQSDCIEVFTMVSENHPGLVVPLADKVLSLLPAKDTKTRWEAVHTLSFIADKVPEFIFSVLPELSEIIEKEKSTIVRDYTIDAIANYARAGKDAPANAFKALKSALGIWGEKHAKQVFRGFSNILDHQPHYSKEIGKLAEPYLGSKRKVVAVEAKKIMKRIEKQA
ncbi:MAG: hypothetical protein JXB00_00195 [Bacteroidales bacterium]|nr:hypothetical protein [Bacteroidales bacterium]